MAEIQPYVLHDDRDIERLETQAMIARIDDHQRGVGLHAGNAVQRAGAVH